MLLSIVVPVFNEQEIIENFIENLVKALEEIDLNYELLMAENGSTDETLSLIKKNAQKNPKIKFFHLPQPSYGQALRQGLEKAKGDLVLVFNADLWGKKFLQFAKENIFGADILVGSKNLAGSSDRRPFLRRLVSRALMLFLKFFLGYKGTDTHGVKIFRRAVLEKVLPDCRLQSGLFDSEILIRAQRKGFKIREEPIDVTEVRAPRFKGRILKTPSDLCELFLILRQP